MYTASVNFDCNLLFPHHMFCGMEEQPGCDREPSEKLWQFLYSYAKYNGQQQRGYDVMGKRGDG